MVYLSKKLIRNEDLEKKIRIICSYNYSKCEVIGGSIISIDNTNVSFIKPHKIIIKAKHYNLLVIYYDKDNLFLYDRRMPIKLKDIESILKHLKDEVA